MGLDKMHNKKLKAEGWTYEDLINYDNFMFRSKGFQIIRVGLLIGYINGLKPSERKKLGEWIFKLRSKGKLEN